MKKILIILAIILVAAAVLCLVGYYNWGWFQSSDSDTSAYEECIAANKAKADGEACTSCVPARAAGPYFKGRIKNGECINVTEPPKYKVSNIHGAVVYNLSNRNFIAPENPQRVPVNTEVSILAISEDQKYANTSYGWLSVEDIERV